MSKIEFLKEQMIEARAFVKRLISDCRKIYGM